MLAIEIGGTKLQFVVGDAAGNLVERRKLTVDASLGAAGIRSQIEQQLPALLRAYRIERVGVGFGGPVDWRTGCVARSHQIEGWSGFDLAGWLRERAGVPVVVDNDANVAALGEARRGAGVGFDPVCYVTLGSGVGGGLVAAGEIYHGAVPGEVEIGHVRLDRAGTTVESRCSGWGVDRRIRALQGLQPGCLLAQMLGETTGGESVHLSAALAQGDKVAGDLLQEVAADLAFGLSHVIHLLHPEVVILGGGLSSVGEPLRAAVARALGPQVMEVFRPGLQIALAALGEDAVPVGALELAKTGELTSARGGTLGGLK
jgi:glucokinase